METLEKSETASPISKEWNKHKSSRSNVGVPVSEHLEGVKGQLQEDKDKHQVHIPLAARIKISEQPLLSRSTYL